VFREPRPESGVEDSDPKGQLMLSPARLTQVVVEMIFLLLGVLVVWLGVTGHINFDRRGIAWLAISVGVAGWGLLALAKPGQWADRLQKWNRGGSMVVLGLLMLTISRVSFLWVTRLLAVCGLVLILRGALGAVLILRQR
jgi:hypothetical protein